MKTQTYIHFLYRNSGSNSNLLNFLQAQILCGPGKRPVCWRNDPCKVISELTDCVPWVVFWKLSCLLSMREERWLFFIVQCITSTQRTENHVFYTFKCVALYYQSNSQEEALRWSFAGVFLHGEWQLCWGWAWLAAVPQCCVPRILSLCNSCSSHRQRDGVRTEETRRGCFHPWREGTRETDTLIVYVCVKMPEQH